MNHQLIELSSSSLYHADTSFPTMLSKAFSIASTKIPSFSHFFSCSCISLVSMLSNDLEIPTFLPPHHQRAWVRGQLMRIPSHVRDNTQGEYIFRTRCNSSVMIIMLCIINSTFHNRLHVLCTVACFLLVAVTTYSTMKFIKRFHKIHLSVPVSCGTMKFNKL